MNRHNDIYQTKQRFKEMLYFLPYLFAAGALFGVYDNWELVKGFFG